MAEKTKTSSGVIAAIAALVLCIVFPRSTWGYIVFIVGGIWAYRVFFSSASSRLKELFVRGFRVLAGQYVHACRINC